MLHPARRRVTPAHASHLELPASLQTVAGHDTPPYPGLLRNEAQRGARVLHPTRRCMQVCFSS